MLPLALLFLLAGGFDTFLAGLKRSPPACPEAIGLPPARDQVWSERVGPWLVRERVVHAAPGIALIGGEVLEAGSVLGIRRRPIRILAVFDRGSWRVQSFECGPEPFPFVITRLAPQ